MIRVPLAVGLVLLLAVGVAADPARRYSGRVQRVELDAGLVVVEELAEQGRLRRHEVYVRVETPIVSVGRLQPRDMRGLNAYGEVPVSLVDLVVGDFVVVDSVEEGGRVIALRITIVESAPSAPRSR